MSPSWGDVEVGDKVTLTYSGTAAKVGEWKGVPEVIFDRGDDTFLHLSPLDFTLKSVEKPVRTFRPGDVVREKSTGRVYTVADNGYYNHTYKTVVMYAAAGFDSSRYELVEG